MAKNEMKNEENRIKWEEWPGRDGAKNVKKSEKQKKNWFILFLQSSIIGCAPNAKWDIITIVTSIDYTHTHTYTVYAPNKLYNMISYIHIFAAIFSDIGIHKFCAHKLWFCCVFRVQKYCFFLSFASQHRLTYALFIFHECTLFRHCYSYFLFCFLFLFEFFLKNQFHFHSYAKERVNKQPYIC